MQDFKKLQAKWNKKLEKSGFIDIEDETERLKSWSIRWRTKKRLNEAKARQPYYELATQFLSEYEFESNLDQIIWEYHSNGLSIREIADTLKKVKIGRHQTRNTVWPTIKRLEEAMKRKYGIIK